MLVGQAFVNAPSTWPWSGLTEAMFVVEPAPLAITEIMYHPADADQTLEWIELHNQQGVDMDVSNWQLADGVDYQFAEGTIIPGGGYVVIAADPAAELDPS